MRAPLSLPTIVSTLLFAGLVAAACGARNELPYDTDSGAVGSGAGSGAGSTTGPGGCEPDCPVDCDDLPVPECYDCEGHAVAATCQSWGWACPAVTCTCAPAIWQRTAVGMGLQRGKAIAVAPDGAVIVGGSFGGTIDLGGETFTSAQPDVHEYDAVTATLLPDGSHVWSFAFGEGKDETIEDLAVDAAGNIVLVGLYRTTQSVGGFPLPGGTMYGQGLFVIKLTPGGEVLFANGFHSSDTIAPVSVGTRVRADVLPNGDVVLAGCVTGTVDFGDGPISGDQTTDVVVARFDSSGEIVYARRFAGLGHEVATDIAVAPNGDVIVTGIFENTLDFGLGPLTSAGAFDVFLIRVDGAGQVVQSASFGGPYNDRGNSVAVDSTGNVILAASYSDGADFGGGTLHTNALNGMLASYDPGGALRWALPFNGPSVQIAGRDLFRLAVDPQDNVILAGQFRGVFDLGGVYLEADQDDYDLVVARVDREGHLVGACRYEGGIAETIGGVAVDPANGEVLITGHYEGKIDLGLGVLSSAADETLFHARLPATGAK